MNIDFLLSGETLLFAGLTLILGYVIFLVLLYLLPRRLKAENQAQQQAVVEKAQKRKEQLLAEARSRMEETLALTREELETNLEDRLQDLEVAEQELNGQDSFVSQAESRIARQEREIAAQLQKVETIANDLAQKEEQLRQERAELQLRLERVAEVRKDDLRNRLVEHMISERQLEAQRRLKDVSDDLSTNSKRLADRTLSRLLSRYAPEFVWPKPVSHVEIVDPRLADLLASDDATLISELTELTQGVEINLTSEKEEGPLAIRLGGGYGIYKEAARLTLEELLPKGPTVWGKAAKTYEKHRITLERQALKLGRQAVNELHLDGLHEEILKMVGALNWRTSYRQNQFYHSLEVAKLAGLLAHEIGVDPDLAKRCGLLHDIGKGIDYRIEGSHAVISGDYADRFGERKIICDTVMSHHNDLVLETPLSYVLKTADTLSGARPGARVNLEEGYQIRLSAIDQVVRSFPGIVKVAIMNGGREVHVEVNHKKIKENEIEQLTQSMARKIEEDVAFPGQIKVLVTRRFEAVSVA